MIVIIFTGGTISMRHDPAAGGAVPSLRGRDILALVPGLADIAAIEVDDWGAFPGPHMTVERMWELRDRVRHHLERPEVEGVVVTHGTDSIEESAYLVARSIAATKPVAFTGAMRTSSDLGWDGPANLSAAVRAASVGGSGLGVVVVMADRIYSALEVTKVYTHMLDAFDSPGFGPLGVIDDGRVIELREAERLEPIVNLDAPATPVDIVLAWAGADARLLDASRDTAKGVVIGAMGRGNVPPIMAEGVERLVKAGKPVVITSRTVRGRVGTTYGYPGAGRRLSEMGALFGGSRRPQQARIDLMLGLGAGMDAAQLRELFESDSRKSSWRGSDHRQ